MIKKISALVLALVLCLSVVVVPTSAMDLGEAAVGYEIKFDKDYYSAGDTAVVSVYISAPDGYELGNFLFSIGLNSSVFTQADNSADDIKASATANDTALTFYKDPTEQGFAWASTAQITAISGSDSAEEQALYDTYLRITGSRLTESDYSNKNGIPSELINADEDPFIQFELKVSADLAAGTAVNGAITSGSIAKNQSYVKYYSNPGNATTQKMLSTVGDSVSYVADSMIYEVIHPLKGQIRFDKNTDGTYANTFDVRALAVIPEADFAELFTDVDTARANQSITEAGFVFAAGSNVAAPSMDAVKALVESGTAATGYTKKTVEYISTSVSTDNYVFSCIVENIPDADVENSLVAVGYIKYVKDGVTSYAYYPAAQTVSYKTLFDAYYGTAFGA